MTSAKRSAEEVPVLIVGGSLVGLTTALLLARHGRRASASWPDACSAHRSGLPLRRWADIISFTINMEHVGDASTNGGVRVVWATAASFGMGPQQAADGSGLSAHDRVAPLHLVDFLVNVARTHVADHIRFSLPLACGDGTLQQRFCATPAAGRVFAKTGTLDGVSSLAGYATTASGRPVTFAFQAAGCGTVARCRAAIDWAVLSIVTFAG